VLESKKKGKQKPKKYKTTDLQNIQSRIAYSVKPAINPATASKADALPPTTLEAELAFAVVEAVLAPVPLATMEVIIPEGAADPLAEAVVELPVALAKNASKEFGLEAFTLMAKTIPCWQCPVCSQKNQRGVTWLIWRLYTGNVVALAATGMKPELTPPDIAVHGLAKVLWVRV